MDGEGGGGHGGQDGVVVPVLVGVLRDQGRHDDLHCDIVTIVARDRHHFSTWLLMNLRGTIPFH